MGSKILYLRFLKVDHNKVFAQSLYFLAARVLRLKPSAATTEHAETGETNMVHTYEKTARPVYVKTLNPAYFSIT